MSAGTHAARARADLPGLHARHPRVFHPDPRRTIALAATLAAIVGLAVFALVRLDFSPLRILRGLSRLGDFALLMLPPSPGGHLLAFLHALGETLAIAFLGTLAAAVLALPVAFLAARNAMPSAPLRFATKRFLDVVRSVDVLIWALVWINVVGLGPFAGALAIACADFGALGKLFAEAIETADRRPQEGVRAAGGNGLHHVRFGLLPSVLPVLASQTLYFFESNTRSATIIGIVGAGGIGQYLTELIRVLELQQVSFLVLMILITVAAIDLVSGRLRRAIIGAVRR